MLGTAGTGRITIRSNAPTLTYAIWTLQNPATQSMVYVNGQGVDSNAGMTIYSFGGTITTSLPALNWGIGASQGTKVFTYVS
jgi:ATP-dependent protease ClpP protease subunit